MKHGFKAHEIIRELEKTNSAQLDMIVPASEIRLKDGLLAIKGESSEIRPGLTFHRQLAAAMGIPGRYYGRMMQETPDLLERNVNTWLEMDDNSYMLRLFALNGWMYGRAFLSDRYKRIDNLEVARYVLEQTEGLRDDDASEFWITEENSRIYMNIVSKDMEAQVVPGDFVRAGIMVSNSEVGNGAVTMAKLLFRLVCSNGMTIPEVDMIRRRRHIGGRVEAGPDRIAAKPGVAGLLEERIGPMDALTDGGWIEAVTEHLFNHIWEPAEDAEAAVEQVGIAIGLTEAERKLVFRQFEHDGDLTNYGLSNAITKIAQMLESYDRSAYMQEAAWRVATMDERHWEEARCRKD